MDDERALGPFVFEAHQTKAGLDAALFAGAPVDVSSGTLQAPLELLLDGCRQRWLSRETNGIDAKRWLAGGGTLAGRS